MKKYLIIFAYVVAYASLLSLGIACMLFVLSLSMSFGPDSGSGSAAKVYPRFFPFNIILGFVSLISLIGIFVFNLFTSEKNGYTKKTWCVQMITSVALALPMIELWLTLIEFLWKIF